MVIKKGDNVIVKAGKDRGKQAKVLRVLVSSNKVVLEGLNVSKHHERTRGKQKGGVVDRPAPVHASNVLLYCSKCKKGVRSGSKMDGSKRTRICRGCEVKI